MTEFKIDLSPPSIFDSIVSILNQSDYEIKDANRDELFIVATKGVTFWSYGETIEIYLKRSERGTKVSVHSYSKGLQVVDWGTNKSNEEFIQSELKKRYS